MESQVINAWPRLLAGIAAGELIKDLLKAEGLTADAVRVFLAKHPERKAEWTGAKEDSAAAFMDEALNVARGVGRIALDELGQPIYGKDGKPLIIRADPAHARNLIDALKWACRLRNPREYGDKAQLDVNVRTVDLTRIISEANARLANAPRARVLEHNQAPAGLLPAVVIPRALADLM